MNAPPKPKSGNEGTFFRFRLDTNLRRELQRAADRDHISVAAFVKRALARALEADSAQRDDLASIAEAILASRRLQRGADLYPTSKDKPEPQAAEK